MPVTHASRVERQGNVERLHVAAAIGHRPLYWTSLYRTGRVLVDSGCSRGRRAVAAYLRRHRVTDALTTHEHEDHVGNHAILPRDVTVHAPGRAVALLREGPPRLPFYRWVTWGAHEAAPGARVAGDVVHADGRVFRVIATPGHSNDHVAYLDEADAAVYGGDAYLGRLRAVRAKEDVAAQMASLRRIAEADPAVLYPAHGPVLPRPRERLLETAEFFENLAARAQRLRDRGLTPRRIRQELLGPEPTITYATLGAFSAENIIQSLLR